MQILLGSDSVKGGLDMTVTLCHRYTPPEDLADAVQDSDLVVSAAGVPGIITKEMVKPGAVLVDVGLTRVCHLGKNLVVGDVHREDGFPGRLKTGTTNFLQHHARTIEWFPPSLG